MLSMQGDRQVTARCGRGAEFKASPAALAAVCGARTSHAPACGARAGVPLTAPAAGPWVLRHNNRTGGVRARRVASAAADNGGNGASWRDAAGSGAGGAAASRADLTASLLSALAAQFQRDSLPWIQDLVVPLLQGPPQPLTDTVSPEALADPDSRFVDVAGVRLHVKSRRGYGGAPGQRQAVQAVAAAAAAAAPAVAAAGEPAGLTVGGDGGNDNDAPTATGVVEGGGGGATAAAGPLPPVLLLMHGLNGSTFSWRLQLDALSTRVSPRTGGCDVVAYDRPPYGLSARPLGGWQEGDEAGNPYTLAGGAKLAAGLLDVVMREQEAAVAAPAAAAAGSGVGGGSSSGGGRQQQQQRAVLVGHSAGAAVAVETALRYPELVSCLVLIAPAVSVDPKGFLARADLGQLLRFGLTRALIAGEDTGVNYVRRQVLKRKSEVEQGRLGIYTDEREVPQEVIDGFLLPLRAHDWDRGTLAVYRSLQVAGAPQPLQQLRVPVLIIQGRQDAAVPLAAAEAVAEALRARPAVGGHAPATELVVLDSCGHVPMDEQPDQVLALTADFINRHCTATAPAAAAAAAAVAPAAAAATAAARAAAAAVAPGGADAAGADAAGAAADEWPLDGEGRPARQQHRQQQLLEAASVMEEAN